MKNTDSYKVLGLMSGTSMDGLDIAFCHFTRTENGWSYTIEKSATLPYSPTWIKILGNARALSGETLATLDATYGHYLGEACAKFVKQHKIQPDFVASHGHTIFHQPLKGLTYQLGKASSLHAASGLPVVSDFRSLDVALGGEGAPLVPAGDRFLFNDYDVCLNLGGIANLSMDITNERRAFDVCFMNMGLNYLASKARKKFDAGGTMAASGNLHPGLQKALRKIYTSLRTKRPSLGREGFEQKIQPLLDNEKISLKDRMRTFTDVSAEEIANVILSRPESTTVLCTGGGAFNSFFMSLLLERCGDHAQLIIPDDEIVKFKEAMVFAFLGVLRIEGHVNCLRTVTGATRDSVGGITIGF